MRWSAITLPLTALLVGLVAWRLLRADPFPAWWAAPLGLINDLFTGLPIGFSIALWSLSMFLLELADHPSAGRIDAALPADE